MERKVVPKNEMRNKLSFQLKSTDFVSQHLGWDPTVTAFWSLGKSQNLHRRSVFEAFLKFVNENFSPCSLVGGFRTVVSGPKHSESPENLHYLNVTAVLVVLKPPFAQCSVQTIIILVHRREPLLD